MKQVEIERTPQEVDRPSAIEAASTEVHSPLLRRRQPWQGKVVSALRIYSVAAAAVAAGLALQLALASTLGPDWPFLGLWPAVLFAAWYGGRGPGLFATALSALAAAYFL